MRFRPWWWSLRCSSQTRLRMREGESRASKTDRPRPWRGASIGAWPSPGAPPLCSEDGGIWRTASLSPRFSCPACVRVPKKKEAFFFADQSMPMAASSWSRAFVQISPYMFLAIEIVVSIGVSIFGAAWDNRLFCLYRFKLWWMKPRMGNSGSDVRIETQMLLLEATKKASINGESHDPFYILFLMKGDSTLKASVFQEAVFVNSGENPFGLVNESMKKVVRIVPSFLEWLFLLVSNSDVAVGNSIPISKVQDEVASAYKKEMEWQTNAMLVPYKQMYIRRQLLF